MNQKINQWGKLKFLEGQNRGRYPYCHTLFWDGDVKILVDPSCGEEAMDALAKSTHIDAILLSHYHEDHFGWFNKFPDAKIYIHEIDAPAIADIDIFMSYYGIERGCETEKLLMDLLNNLFKFKPRKADVLLKDGMSLDFPDLHIETIHTPGHTPGHCCFYFREPDVLFLADFDLTRFGPYYGDRVSDIDVFIESSKKVRHHSAAYKITSHEEAIFSGDLEKNWTDYLGVIDRREKDLIDFLSEPRTIREIMQKRIIYKKPRQPAAFYDLVEESTMMKHVERLIAKGLAGVKDGRFFMIG